MDKILKRLNEFNIKNCRMVRLSAANAIQFYENKAGDSMLPFLMEHLISGPVLGLELVGVKAMQMLLDIAGKLYVLVFVFNKFLLKLIF